MSKTKSQSLRQYVTFGALFVLSIVTLISDAVGQEPAELHSNVTASTVRFLGTRSCAAAACHGDANAPGVAGQEFVYWLENDPHGTANRSLHSDLGRRMMAALNIKQGDSGYHNCQACHDPYVNEPTLITTPRISEAVGCEACHGPSAHWVADHYRPYWQALSAEDKSQYGMIDTHNLVVRARLCGKCHVGAADREVNHDMIAAGHPPLKFELAAYHEMLPKHWDAHGERLQASDFELLLWGYGQLVGAEAALHVLQTRATRTVARKATAKPDENDLPNPLRSGDNQDFPHHAWPELAEYNCFSCHQNLVEPSWRQERGYIGRVGMAEWQSWYFALPLSPTIRALEVSRNVDNNVNAVRELMEARYNTASEDVAEAARKAKVEVSAVLDALALLPVARSVEASELIRTLANHGQNGGYVRNWDTAVQVYLSTFALHRNKQSEQMPRSFQQVRQYLRFPATYDSPHGFGGRAPSTSDTEQPLRQRIQESLETLVRTVQAEETGN